MTNHNENLTLNQQLNLPFHYLDYKVNYEGHAYIGVQNIVNRLNDVLGMFNWTHKAVQVDIDQERHSVSVFGRLEIWDADNQRWISREQYGDDPMTIKKGESEPDAQAAENAKKSAMSDSLKKCAAWFGVGSDLFAGKVTVLRPNTTPYLKVATNYGLDTSYRFKYGIPVLPDSYRSYYSEMSWNGIFESDVAALMSGKTPKGNSEQESTQQPPKSNTGSNNSTPPAQGNNTPQKFRLRAESGLTVNQDGTSVFEAQLENQSIVKVFIPKDQLTKAKAMIKQGGIYQLDGWHNEKGGTIRLGKRANIVRESANQSA
jgi:hypothetical protein